MSIFLMGCFPDGFQEVKRPLRTPSGKRPINRDSFVGGDVDGVEAERFLSTFYMTIRCRWPSGERHRTVMQMLRSFGLP